MGVGEQEAEKQAVFTVGSQFGDSEIATAGRCQCLFCASGHGDSCRFDRGFSWSLRCGLVLSGGMFAV